VHEKQKNTKLICNLDFLCCLCSGNSGNTIFFLY